MISNRQSNIELLRIFAIIAIICHHVLVHGVGIYNVPFEQHNWLYSFVNNLCYMGVYIFILISGYFSIRFSWKKLLHLYLMCAVIAGLGYLWHCYRADVSIGRTFLYTTVFAFSRCGVWYVLPYVCLFMLSPFINPMIEQLSKKSFQRLLVVLFILSCYFGWFWQTSINTDGFGLMQFITMYAVGYYIRRFDVAQKLRTIAWGGGFLISVILQTLLVYYLLRVSGRTFPPVPSIFAYNSPFVMIASVACLCMFLNMKIQSKAINFIAMSTFGVYLIHCNPYIWREWLDALCPLYMHSFAGVIATVLIVFVVCVLFDLLLRYTIIIPLQKSVIKLFETIKKK